jgi:hypothetical protein
MKHKVSSDPLMRRLRIFAQGSPALADAARVYEAILPMLRDADLHAAPASLDPAQIRERLQQRVPLLSGLELDIDISAAHDLMLRLADAVENAGNKSMGLLRLPWASSGETHAGAAAQKIRKVLETDALDIAPLLAHAASGEHAPIVAIAEGLGLDFGLLLVLAQNTLKPAMHAWRRQLAPLAGEIEWHKSSCYICGTTAVFAELQENDQAKHLRCKACGADWRVRRLACAYCGNEDHKTLQNFSPDGSGERMRVEVCDACGRYLKVIASFAPTPPEELALVDLETLPLDYMAQGRGYRAWAGPS